jgi:hypothetical protein
MKSQAHTSPGCRPSRERPQNPRETALSRALAERAAAPGLYAELMAICPRARLLAAQQDPRFASLGLVAHLLAQPSPEHPEAAERRARLALELLGRLGPGRYPARLVGDFESRAWLALAEAKARRPHVAATDAALARAALALARGSGDGLEVAHHLERHAAVRRRLGRRGEARRLLRRARRLRASSLSNPGRTGRTDSDLSWVAPSFLGPARPPRTLPEAGPGSPCSTCSPPNPAGAPRRSPPHRNLGAWMRPER